MFFFHTFNIVDFWVKFSGRTIFICYTLLLHHIKGAKLKNCPGTPKILKTILRPKRILILKRVHVEPVREGSESANELS